MTTPVFNHDAPGEFPAPGTVRLVRLLPGPIDRVWDYLTVPEKRARWICGGALEQRPGGTVEFAMQHKNLAPDETPPAKYAHVQDPGVTFEGRVLRCDRPHLLEFTFGDDNSIVTFELTPQGEHVLLVLTHRAMGAELPELPNYSSGWHTHLSLLSAELAGQPRPPFWATHRRLVEYYQARLATHD
jgi:uncharacterized protein YndB with AHSA1/START domain